jgi:aryl-alcohol dehydrogenase-like predicted oxidoreductase
MIKLSKEQQAIVDRIDNGEDVWSDDDAVVDIPIAPRAQRVVQLRLAVDKWDALRREAKELGVTPTTLARMWILEHLKTTSPTQ